MQQGDRGALAALYDETSSALHGMLLRIAGDPAAAQEATVEAYARAWNRIHTWQPERSGLLAWLILLARGAALERQPRRGTAAAAAPAGSAREIVERAFFEGWAETQELRAAIARLRNEREEGSAE